MSKQVTNEMWPSRFVHTSIVLLRAPSQGHTHNLLLVNPTPRQWDDWQLPYASKDYDVLSDDSDGSTINELIDIVSSQTGHVNATTAEIVDHVSDLIGSQVQPDSVIPIKYENYSLKFSQSACVYSFYQFTYMLLTLVEQCKCEILHSWMPLNKDQVKKVSYMREFDGRKLAGNIIDLLADPGTYASLTR